ncbi:MAG: restriction endonuclease [Anaerolineae bacterium]|nr:restriction endonuclease [Anaerolineae bacterium]
MSVSILRQRYHHRICEEIVRFDREETIVYPNFADKSNKSSKAIALAIMDRIGYSPNYQGITEQTADRLFESITKDFLQESFELLRHLRPGQWYYLTEEPILVSNHYFHLNDTENIIEQNRSLITALGTDYIIHPDIVIGRYPVSDEEINQQSEVISSDNPFAKLTPLREANAAQQRCILHASISCKWTLRSDRGQNARTEALNLIRNRKGPLPHIVAVTAEPLPTRIASLALGTGDLDCVYHFALNELHAAIEEIENEDQLDMLMMLVDGRRLRDISDLPFDLAI